MSYKTLNRENSIIYVDYYLDTNFTGEAESEKMFD